MGLSLARALDADADLGARLADRLRKAEPASAEEELALLEKALRAPAEPSARPENDKPATPRKPKARPTSLATIGNVSVTTNADQSEITISGSEFGADFQRKLIHWLRYNLRR